MKRMLLFGLIVCLCLAAWSGAALGEAAEEAASMTAEALFQAAKDAYSANDYEKAQAYYQLAANQGYVDAMYNLGIMYQGGYGVAQDYEKAAEYYRKAMEADDPMAAERLNRLIEEGHIQEWPLERTGGRGIDIATWKS